MGSPSISNQDKNSTAEAAMAQFVNVVSHDFSAPLRHARFFSSALVSSLGDDIDESQRELAENVESSLVKMESMLAALLRYSRLISAFNPNDKIDIHDMLNSLTGRFVCDSIEYVLRVFPPEQTVEIIGDYRQLTLLLNELIDNAIKFRSPDRDLEIEVSVSIEDKNMTLVITDNGSGMSEKEQAFALPIFRQLDPCTDGQGVGLALAQRVAENHRGGLAITSHQPHGLNVTVTIPIQSSE